METIPEHQNGPAGLVLVGCHLTDSKYHGNNSFIHSFLEGLQNTISRYLCMLSKSRNKFSYGCFRNVLEVFK
jgi:hypothetical protein